MNTVYRYTPLAAITPYFLYGKIRSERIQKKLERHNIPSVIEEKKRVNPTPQGSGQGGRRRLGDEMLPSTYEIKVKDAFAEVSRKLLVHNIDPTNEKFVKLLS
jgi:hypothetical protein